eukprot:358340-Chlamydomonas_euryale.AAC.6
MVGGPAPGISPFRIQEHTWSCVGGVEGGGVGGRGRECKRMCGGPRMHNPLAPPKRYQAHASHTFTPAREFILVQTGRLCCLLQPQQRIALCLLAQQPRQQRALLNLRGVKILQCGSAQCLEVLMPQRCVAFRLPTKQPRQQRALLKRPGGREGIEGSDVGVAQGGWVVGQGGRCLSLRTPPSVHTITPAHPHSASRLPGFNTDAGKWGRRRVGAVCPPTRPTHSGTHLHHVDPLLRRHADAGERWVRRHTQVRHCQRARTENLLEGVGGRGKRCEKCGMQMAGRTPTARRAPQTPRTGNLLEGVGGRGKRCEECGMRMAGRTPMA